MVAWAVFTTQSATTQWQSGIGSRVERKRIFQTVNDQVPNDTGIFLLTWRSNINKEFPRYVCAHVMNFYKVFYCLSVGDCMYYYSPQYTHHMDMDIHIHHCKAAVFKVMGKTRIYRFESLHQDSAKHTPNGYNMQGPMPITVSLVAEFNKHPVTNAPVMVASRRLPLAEWTEHHTVQWLAIILVKRHLFCWYWIWKFRDPFSPFFYDFFFSSCGSNFLLQSLIPSQRNELYPPFLRVCTPKTSG